jgi:hypothetical protein
MGYCVLRVPEDGGTPHGFAGVGGQPVGTGLPATGELGAIRGMIDSLARQIEDIQARIRDLQREEG